MTTTTTDRQRVALVAGASRGIGADIAAELGLREHHADSHVTGRWLTRSSGARAGRPG